MTVSCGSSPTDPGRGREAFSRPPAWRARQYRGKMGVVIPVWRGGGAHGRTRRQQEIRLRDEARGGARPCGAWADEGRSHGEVQDRGPRPVGALVPRVPVRRPGRAASETEGQAQGAKSKPRPAPTREQLLEEENAYLKARVAYLEKVDALLAWRSATGTER